MKGQNKYAIGNKKLLGSKMLTFTPELEKELTFYISNMETMLFGLTCLSVRSLAYQLAVKNNIGNRFNLVKQKTEWHSLTSFLKRHNLSLRTPEPTSAARARGFKKANVHSFFDLLKGIQNEKKITPGRIFNVDEMSADVSVPTCFLPLSATTF